MKPYVPVIFMMIVVACNKKSGKYCPVMTLERTKPHLADLSQVSHIPQIMDTLNKYPQLQVYDVYLLQDYGPGSFSARASCNIYFQDLLIFDKTCSLFWNNYGSVSPLTKPNLIPTEVNTSISPDLSAEEANTIAEKATYFSNCQLTQLGLKNLGTDSIPDYRLTWRVKGAGSRYPVVDIDAHSGTVYRVNAGINYN